MFIQLSPCSQVCSSHAGKHVAECLPIILCQPVLEYSRRLPHEGLTKVKAVVKRVPGANKMNDNSIWSLKSSNICLPSRGQESTCNRQHEWELNLEFARSNICGTGYECQHVISSRIRMKALCKQSCVCFDTIACDFSCLSTTSGDK